MSRKNQDLAGLRKFLRSKAFEKANVKKLEYFTKSTDVLPDAPDWLENAVFLSFDMEWYSEWRKVLGSHLPQS